MRMTIDFILLLVVVAGGAYIAHAHPRELQHVVRQARNTIAPCSAPVTYSIGSIDPGFGVATSSLIADLRQAEDAWEKASGKDLFSYRERGGEITVNLLYDERQAATDKLSSLGIKIDESKATYDSLRAKYNALSATVQTQQLTYTSKVAQYEKREAAYNATVKKWNEAGGAPPSEYEQLKAEKRSLESQLAEIRSAENQLNKNIDTLNALATTLNQLIVQLNLNVDQYNQTGAMSGEFEEGLYEVQSGIATITIYEFSNTTKLIRVLAHEMGHALGMEHIEDSSAIMYKINKGTTLVATDADTAELDRVCSSRRFAM